MKWIVIVAMLGACGGGDNDTGGPCAQRSGLYRVTYVQKSGNCGPVNEAVINMDAAGEMTGACSGTSALSPDGCEATVDLRCAQPGTNRWLLARGKTLWSASGSTGTSYFYLELQTMAGAPLCAGTYDATFSRI